MRKWIFATGLMGALVLQSNAASAALPTDTVTDNYPLRAATMRWTQAPLPDERSVAVSFLEAAQLRGRLLPLVLGIATLDLALATFYWGVYVPYYADQEPAYDHDGA
ncbi:hypothetical protein N9Z25_05660 [Luminiphilus sp.]|nr:hypothetical protein [Luminiphilus sp.]